MGPITKLVTKTNIEPSQNMSKNMKPTSLTKKLLKTVKRDGKVVKLSKKEKMKLRTGLLKKKLTSIEKDKTELKEKKRREQVVIVKDTKPLLDNLEEIAEEIKIETKEKELKAKRDGLKKASKHTMKMKKRKDQFMKDIEFLKAASMDPEYVA